jgi:hypothetical protein
VESRSPQHIHDLRFKQYEAIQKKRDADIEKEVEKRGQSAIERKCADMLESNSILMGKMEGQVRIQGGLPRFVLELSAGGKGKMHFDPVKRYLIVKVLSIGQIITPDQRAMDDLDCFVEVKYSKISTSYGRFSL